MIDSAGDRGERQYEFSDVVRWMAEHADLVVLFFDPEKPGTTGETLGVLTESLSGIDHKLRIVMNKMDLFDGLRDFARTYGALCWNLSRSLGTKDMPHIFTTVIPELMRPDAKLPMDGFASALLELEALINDLPDRRIDNILNSSIREAKQLLVRAKIMLLLQRRQGRVRRRGWLYGIILLLIAGAGSFAFWQLSAITEAAIAGGAGIALLTISVIMSRWLSNKRRRKDIANIDHVFTTVHRNELVGRDKHLDLLATWESVRPTFQRQLRDGDKRALAPVSAGKVRKLEKLITTDLPNLRQGLSTEK